MPEKPVAKPSIERLLVAAALAFGMAPLLGVAGVVATRGWLSLAVARMVLVPVIIVVAVRCTSMVARRLPAGLDGLARRAPTASWLWLLLAFLALAQLARISIFMIDPAARWASAFPPSVEASQHTCLSAYVHAAELHRRGEDVSIYQPDHYRDPAAHTSIDNLAPYLGDAFLYPPPFLVIGRALLLISGDFLIIRSTWFVLVALTFVAGSVSLAFWIGGREGLRVGLLLPTVLIAIPTLLNFQFGQLHLVTLTSAMLAMVAFERQRVWVGGPLLALAMLFKIFPGILFLYLVLQRRWRPVFATLASIVALSLASLMLLGPEPFAHYLQRTLDIGMGGDTEATSMVILANDVGAFRIAEKLSVLNVVQNPEQLGSILLWLYSITLVGIAWCAARRQGGRREQALIWLGLLALASLRAPAAPSAYIAVSAIWLLSLLGARVGSIKKGAVIAAVIAWLLLQGLPGAPSPELLIALSFVPQLVFVCVAWRAIFSAGTLGSGMGRPLATDRTQSASV